MGNLVEDGWRGSSRTPRGAPSRCAGSESEFGKGLLRVDGVGDGWRESSRPELLAACRVQRLG
jgi:hypothetical protein